MTGTDDLLCAAAAAREKAYAPYSGFRVGAALATPSGSVYAGCNVENASYPLGLCAEAGAIAAMVAAGEREIREIVVLAEDAFAPPCGACRQRIFEFADGATKIVLADRQGARRIYACNELLPHAFDLPPKGRAEA